MSSHIDFLGQLLHNYSIEILLGTASPRRHELMKLAQIPFTRVRISHDEETIDPDLPAIEYCSIQSKLKSAAFGNPGSSRVLITADTVVDFKGRAINKPKDSAEARHILENYISGQRHIVHTSVTLSGLNRPALSFLASTEVFFNPVRPEDISYYISNYDVLDRAGAYGIQEFIGLIGLKELRGDYFNIMGLSISSLRENLITYILEAFPRA